MEPNAQKRLPVVRGSKDHVHGISGEELPLGAFTPMIEGFIESIVVIEGDVLDLALVPRETGNNAIEFPLPMLAIETPSILLLPVVYVRVHSRWVGVPIVPTRRGSRVAVPPAVRRTLRVPRGGTRGARAGARRATSTAEAFIELLAVFARLFLVVMTPVGVIMVTDGVVDGRVDGRTARR